MGYDAADEPEVVLVSNYHDLAGNVVGPTYPHSLNAIHLSLDGKRILIAHVGSLDLTEAERGYLYREARPSSRHGRPTRLVNARLKVLRDASHRSEGKIGTAAVVTIMPRGAVPVTFNPTFMNWPGDVALASSIHMSFAVPNEDKRQDGRGYGPAIWKPEGGSTFGYRSLATPAGSDSAEQEIMREGDLEVFDKGQQGLDSTMKGFPPSIFEDFPRHPAP